MKIEYSLNPNCSEAVFRFYTLEPEKIQKVLQALADEINANTGYEPHKEQDIPLFDSADEYQTKVTKVPERISGTTFNVRKYENALLSCCAGLGDNECQVTVEKKNGAFVLNIGNNDICDNNTGWVEKVMEMGIKVEEAERSPSLAQKYARDCTCGITFFPKDYPGLITEDKGTRG
jgi:hypothetical protein